MHSSDLRESGLEEEALLELEALRAIWSVELSAIECNASLDSREKREQRSLAVFPAVVRLRFPLAFADDLEGAPCAMVLCIALREGHPGAARPLAMAELEQSPGPPHAPESDPLGSALMQAVRSAMLRTGALWMARNETGEAEVEADAEADACGDALAVGGLHALIEAARDAIQDTEAGAGALQARGHDAMAGGTSAGVGEGAAGAASQVAGGLLDVLPPDLIEKAPAPCPPTCPADATRALRCRSARPLARRRKWLQGRVGERPPPAADRLRWPLQVLARLPRALLLPASLVCASFRAAAVPPLPRPPRPAPRAAPEGLYAPLTATGGARGAGVRRRVGRAGRRGGLGGPSMPSRGSWRRAARGVALGVQSALRARAAMGAAARRAGASPRGAAPTLDPASGRAGRAAGAPGRSSITCLPKAGSPRARALTLRGDW